MGWFKQIDTVGRLVSEERDPAAAAELLRGFVTEDRKADIGVLLQALSVLVLDLEARKVDR